MRLVGSGLPSTPGCSKPDPAAEASIKGPESTMSKTPRPQLDLDRLERRPQGELGGPGWNGGRPWESDGKGGCRTG